MSQDEHAVSRAEVAVVGSYPPPYGGMSMHAVRLTGLLARHGVSYRVYNGVGDFDDPPLVVNVRRRARRFALASLLRARHRLYYVMTVQTSGRFWAGLMALAGRRVILRVGGASLANALAASSRLSRWMTRFALRRVWGVIGVSAAIASLAAEIRGSDERVWAIPGYLHPGPDERTVVDEAGEQFLAAHEPKILAMGRFTEQKGKEVYGVPLLIELLDRLRQRHQKAGLFFALTCPEDLKGPKWPALRDRIEQLGLREHFHFHNAASPLVGLMRRCELLVRPSNTDGDSNALREALACGLPVVASDCVVRPPGAVLHRTGDEKDLAEKVLFALDHREQLVRQLQATDMPDNWPALREMFSRALERPLQIVQDGKP